MLHFNDLNLDTGSVTLTIIIWLMYILSFILLPYLQTIALISAIIASISTIIVNYLKYKENKTKIKK